MLIVNRTEAKKKNTEFLFTSSSNQIKQGEKKEQRTIILETWMVRNRFDENESFRMKKKM